jgi:DNA-binding transcriptional regulator LsrR (DeoR family)
MPRTNRTQKYAALWLHSQGWNVSKISNELDLTDTQVKRIVKEVQSENKIKTASSVVSKDPNSKNLMITESQSGTHKVSVMTKSASEDHEQQAKKYMDIKKIIEDNIYRPLG